MNSARRASWYTNVKADTYIDIPLLESVQLLSRPQYREPLAAAQGPPVPPLEEMRASSPSSSLDRRPLE